MLLFIMSHVMNSKINKNKSRTRIVLDDDYCVNYGKVKNNAKYFTHTGATIVNGISIVKINIQKEEDSSTVKIEKQEEKNNNIVIR